MSVTDYTLSNCTYNNMRLRNVLYIVSKQHVKDIQIDNGTAFIQSLSENPVKINLNNIDFREESTVDDRYRFSKTLQATVNGYVNLSSLNEKYYAIIVTEDGTPFMINVDFPSDVTYVYTLSDDIDQTVITFSSQSNFPSLRLTEDFGNATECKQYTMSCIKSLKLVDHEKAKLDTEAGSVVLYNTSFSEVEFLRNEFTYTENFNGQYALSTIAFSIPLGAYKSSWHYNLLEWMQNRYSAVIEGCNGYVFAGFNHGLIPSYTIEGTGENAMINITLVESSSFGSSSSYEFNPSSDDTTHWMYVVTVDGDNAFECVSNGFAKYLLMAEADVNGNRTGKYMVLEGYESMFPSLNIVGTFSEVVTFSNPTCVVDDGSINTTLDNVTLPTGTCASYSLSASCSWNITNIPNGWTITPSSGEANTQYEIQVCNVSGAVGTSYIQINYCNKTKNASLTSTGDGGGNTSITPKLVMIDCTRQQVTFIYDSTCPITVTSIPSGLTYTLGLSTLVVTVPANETTSERTFSIEVTDCHGVSETVSIIQSQMYEKWVVDDSSYICDDGDKYAKEVRYTGTTDQNYVMTDTVRKGELIESGSTDCQGAAEYRWYDDGRFYCDGNYKYHALLEQLRYGSGGTWQYTGNAKLGDLVGEDAEFCGSGNTTYSWSASTRSYCYSGETPTPPEPPVTDYKYVATYTNGDTSYAECSGSNETLSSSDIPNISNIRSVVIGDCVSLLDDYVFYNREYLSSVTLGNGVETIGAYCFGRCANLSSITIPNSVATIDNYAFRESGLLSINIGSGTIGNLSFYDCDSLTSVTIGNNVTNIGQYAFQNCYALMNVTIGNGVTSIGKEAFYNCTDMVSITINATTPPSLPFNSGVFDNTNNCPIYVPAASVNTYKTASRWSDYASRIQAIGS